MSLEQEEVPQFAKNKTPLFLKLTYILLPLWGILWFILYWNGSKPDFLNPGHWAELQKIANTKLEPK